MHPHSLAFLEGIGGPELLLVMFIVLILFGSNRLPELARGLGKSVREFKKATSNIEEEIKQAMEEEPPKRPTRTTAALPPPVKASETQTPPSPPEDTK